MMIYAVYEYTIFYYTHVSISEVNLHLGNDVTIKSHSFREMFSRKLFVLRAANAYRTAIL